MGNTPQEQEFKQFKFMHKKTKKKKKKKNIPVDIAKECTANSLKEYYWTRWGKRSIIFYERPTAVIEINSMA